MTNFNWDDFRKRKICVYCPTIEIARDFLIKMYQQNFGLINDTACESSDFIRQGFDYWETYAGNTCFFCQNNELTYSSLGFAIEAGYSIKPWFINNEFSINDLKSWDYIKCKNGNVYMYSKEQKTFIYPGGCLLANEFDSKLRGFGNPDFDVVEIYRPTKPEHCYYPNYNEGLLIYKKEPQLGIYQNYAPYKYLGTLGTPTTLVDFNNIPLCVGDIVEVFNRNLESLGKNMIIDNCYNDSDDVIIKRKSFSDFKPNDEFNNVIIKEA